MGRDSREMARLDRAPGARERQGRGEAACPGGFGVGIEVEHQRLLAWANGIDLERRIAEAEARVRDDERKAARALAGTLAAAEALPSAPRPSKKSMEARPFYLTRIGGRLVEFQCFEGRWNWRLADVPDDDPATAWSAVDYVEQKNAARACSRTLYRARCVQDTQPAQPRDEVETETVEGWRVELRLLRGRWRWRWTDAPKNSPYKGWRGAYLMREALLVDVAELARRQQRRQAV